MSAALNHASSPLHPAAVTATATAPGRPARRRTWTYVGLALLLASMAVAAAVLPFVWNLLGTINALPKMAWLQQLLASLPAASWVLMLVWGTAVPLAMLAALSRTGHARSSLVLVAALTLWAVTWYVHMPALSQCTALYAGSALCGALKWAFSLSLGMGTSIYIFAIFLLGVAALCLLTEDSRSDSGNAVSPQ